MNAQHHCFAELLSSPLPSGDKFTRREAKAPDFAQLPSWVSLKSTSPSLNSPQFVTGRVENVHLVSLSKQGKLDEALQFLRRMNEAGITVAARSYHSLFEACACPKSLSDGRLIHGEFKRQVKNPSGSLENSLLRMYCECGGLRDAVKVFDEMLERDLISWRMIISAFAEKGFLSKAVSFFSNMLVMGIKPNSSIYIGILKSLASPSLLEVGKQLQSHAIRNGLGDIDAVNTAVSNMYVKCGWLEGAELVLDRIIEKNAAIWTGLMAGYIQAEKQNDALALFTRMVGENVELDEYAFSTILKACAFSEELEFGRQVHGHVIKLGLESHVHVGTTLVDFYSKCALFESASRAFESITEPNDFSWSALIANYCRLGEFEQSLKIFNSLRSKSGDLNSFAYTSILQACSALADFNIGTQVHADAIKRNLVASQHGESSLITMYSRCGKLINARQAFESIAEPDPVAWTAMIAGYAYQGNAGTALDFFRRMEESGVRPNAVTFVAVLTACSHGGLVTQGRRLLDCMSSHYNVPPTLDHYDCMIDVYSRAGFLQEALDLIRTMPFAPDAMSWKCLLSGCLTHRNIELGVIAAESLFQLDPDDTAGYILMFNLYASFGRWQEAGRIRKTMTERNLRKELSCSWITVEGRVHRFVVGDKHHPRTAEIYSKLEEFSEDHYVDGDHHHRHNGLLLTEEDVSSERLARKEQLLVHSERLAIAFGLISLPKEVPIVVFKNLRACNDCHEFAKYVSMVTSREIVVRDSFRFHQFKSGGCSCNDYW